MTNSPLEILWQDAHIGIINKPAGLLMHPSGLSSETDTLISRLKQQFTPPPIPVHRLDRPVSGAILGAYDKETAAALSQAIRQGAVRKTYIAVVRGFLEGEGEIAIPLKKAETGCMQDALSLYKTIDRVEQPLPTRRYDTSRYSLVLLSPLTGRFHQLRRHMARIGYPIIGDTSHGDTFSNHHFEEHFDTTGLLLHSLSLEFIHPHTEKRVIASAPLREKFRDICRRFDWPLSDGTLLQQGSFMIDWDRSE